jgi:hypothetical protein
MQYKRVSCAIIDLDQEFEKMQSVMAAIKPGFSILIEFNTQCGFYTISQFQP